MAKKKKSKKKKEKPKLEGQLAEFKKAFFLFDKVGDGTITTKELGSLLKAVGQNPTDAALQDMIVEVDNEGHGAIDFPEFMSLIARKLDKTPEFNEAFSLDNYGDGSITTKEVRTLMRSLGQNPTEAMMQDMIDEVGADTFPRFMSVVASKQKEKKPRNPEGKFGDFQKAFSLSADASNGTITTKKAKTNK